jgi:hypothetical protein
MITHTAKLPFGFTVEFLWIDTASSPGRMQVNWTPDVPRFPSSASKRAKFFAAYVAERNIFGEMVADSLGGAVMIVDTDCRDFAHISSVIAPPTTKH